MHAVLSAAAAVALAACGPAKVTIKRERTYEQKVVAVQPDATLDLAWVTIADITTEKRTRVERDYAGRTSTSPDGSQVERVENLWLCYRRPRDSRPQCFRPKWHRHPGGPLMKLEDSRPGDEYVEPDDDAEPPPRERSVVPAEGSVTGQPPQ